jgi:peptide/nickel transport system permease protein
MNASFAQRLLTRPLAVLSIAWLLFVVFCAFFPGLITGLDPLDQDLLAVKQLPSSEHWLGTDMLGRDILARLVHGAYTTIAGVLQALAVALVLSVGMGVSAGYLRGRWDHWVAQYVNLTMSMPFLITALAVLMVVGRSMMAAMLTFGVLASAGSIRLVRSVTLNVREELYIEAARISGLSDLAIVWRHVLPRIVGPIIVSMSLFAAAAITTQTGISFLGLGVLPPAPTWGGMIYDAATSVSDFPWMLVPSGAVVALSILSFGLLGDALTDTAAETWSRASSQHKPQTRQLSADQPVLPEGTVLAMRGVSIRTVASASQASRILVDNISFSLKAGETLGIVGESGSGKTLTSLSLLGLLPAGVEVADGEASLVVNGQMQRIALNDVTKLAAWRGKTVGMIFQEPMAALDPCFTVGHHISEVIRAHAAVSASAANEQALALLRQVQILDPEAVAKRYPHQISGGMAQRVGIARALALKPTVLLADEPTTALDVTVQAEILELLRDLSRQYQMAVVLVTHDWGVVADICDRALVLYQGRTMEQASVMDLFERPQHAYTQALLKANPHHVKAGERLPTIAQTMQGLAK